jgi:hypothetical protein
MICPWCGFNSVDITIMDCGFDQRPKFLCTGPDSHEFREGDGPDPSIPSLVVLATR